MRRDDQAGVPTVFGDVLITDPSVFADICKLRLPYRSVEINDPKQHRFSALALLSDEVPYFKFPLTAVDEQSIEGTAPTMFCEYQGDKGIALIQAFSDAGTGKTRAQHFAAPLLAGMMGGMGRGAAMGGMGGGGDQQFKRHKYQADDVDGEGDEFDGDIDPEALSDEELAELLGVDLGGGGEVDQGMGMDDGFGDEIAEITDEVLEEIMADESNLKTLASMLAPHLQRAMSEEGGASTPVQKSAPPAVAAQETTPESHPVSFSEHQRKEIADIVKSATQEAVKPLEEKLESVSNWIDEEDFYRAMASFQEHVERTHAEQFDEIINRLPEEHRADFGERWQKAVAPVAEQYARLVMGGKDATVAFGEVARSFDVGGFIDTERKKLVSFKEPEQTAQHFAEPERASSVQPGAIPGESEREKLMNFAENDPVCKQFFSEDFGDLSDEEKLIVAREGMEAKDLFDTQDERRKHITTGLAIHRGSKNGKVKVRS